MSSTNGRVLIDTNVLAYRYDRASPEKAQRARAVLGELASAGTGVISAWPVLGVQGDTAREAVFLAARDGLSIWDAQLVATARTYGVQTLLSEDLSGGRDYDGVTVVDPFAPGFDPRTLR